MSLNNRKILERKREEVREREGGGEREREEVRERGVGRWLGRSAGLFKVRLGLGEIEGRDRERYREIQSDRET